MEYLMYFAGSLFVILGLGHSYAGERYVLPRILRMPDLPRLAGSTLYMQRILRLAWHVTSIAWFGLAAVVVLLIQPSAARNDISIAVGLTALASFVLVLAGSRGKHYLAWAMFLVASLITLYYGVSR
jgi:hypothetical protein